MDGTVSDSVKSISEFQRNCVEVFVRAAQVLALPRSIGEIYGLLYGTNTPMPMDAIIHALGISKGSASQGLRWLRDVGAVRTVYVPGDRRDHFLAETELRKLAAGFIDEQLQPHLNSGSSLLTRLELTARSAPDPRFASTRVKKLRRWHRFGRHVLPLLLQAAARF